jgi:hypothetical protein
MCRKSRENTQREVIALQGANWLDIRCGNHMFSTPNSLWWETNAAQQLKPFVVNAVDHTHPTHTNSLTMQ